MTPHEMIHFEKYRRFSRVFGSVEGQQVLADICEMGFVNKPTFCPTSPEKTILNEGSRVLALAILKIAKKNPTTSVSKSITDNEL